MKNIMIVLAALMLCASCQKNEDIGTEQVSFTVNLLLTQSGDMSRATAAELYDDFYNEFIVTRELVYSGYELDFYKGDVLVASFDGTWDVDTITLPCGEYNLVGTSAVNSDYNSDSYYKTSLRFEQKVIISPSTTSIELMPIYDCYLLLFDASQFNYASYAKSSDGAGKREFAKAGDVYYIFINSLLDSYSDAHITYQSKDGKYGSVRMSDYGFQKGKYYAFDIYSSSFTVPRMEQGL